MAAVEKKWVAPPGVGTDSPAKSDLNLPSYREKLKASILPSSEPYSDMAYSRSHTALDQPVPKFLSNNPLSNGIGLKDGKAPTTPVLVDEAAEMEEGGGKKVREYERHLYLYRNNLPILTRVRRAYKHPLSRTIVPLVALVLRFKSVAIDPMGHSEVEASVPIMGEVISMIFLRYSAKGGIVFAKVICWLAGGGLFAMLGLLLVHHRLLRDTVGLKMFEGAKGSWFCMFLSGLLGIYASSYTYNMIAEDEEQVTAHLNVSEVSFRKMHAAVVWIGGAGICAQIFDMVAQDVSQYPYFLRRLRNLWREAGGGWFRLAWFWIVSTVATVLFMLVAWTDVLWFDDGGFQYNPMGLIEGGDEFDRVLWSAFTVLLDLLVITQDWEFPTMDTNQLYIIPGLAVQELSVTVRPFGHVHVNGKWVVYGTLLSLVTVMDLRMLVAQVRYEPGMHAQYRAQGDRVWNILDPALVAAVDADQTAGGAAVAEYLRAGGGGGIGGRGTVVVPLDARHTGSTSAARVPYALPAILAIVIFMGVIFSYRDNTESIKRRLQARFMVRRWQRAVQKRRRGRAQQQEDKRAAEEEVLKQAQVHRSAYWQLHHGGGGGGGGGAKDGGAGGAKKPGASGGNNGSRRGLFGMFQGGAGGTVHPIYAGAVPHYMYGDT